MITVSHARARLGLPLPPRRGAGPDARFFDRLEAALAGEAFPAGRDRLAASLFYATGRANFWHKPDADAFAAWLRTLCGRRSARLIAVEST